MVVPANRSIWPFIIAGLLIVSFLLWSKILDNKECQIHVAVDAVQSHPADKGNGLPHATDCGGRRDAVVVPEAKAISAIRRFGDILRSYLDQRLNHFDIPSPSCSLVSYGSSWGVHSLCNVGPTISGGKECNFISYGIATDYSFDTDLQDRHNCNGFLLDPTVSHPSTLGTRLLFFHLAAPMLTPLPSGWKAVNPFELSQLMGLEEVTVLKMDCEGCEYAIARDVAKIDPSFFHRVKQFSVEIHVSKLFAPTREHIVNYGRLLHYLEEAGLKLRSAQLWGCARQDEEPYGCGDILESVGYPCAVGMMCHNFLFSKA